MNLPLEAKRWNRFVALLASAFFFLCLPIGTNDESMFDVKSIDVRMSGRRE